MYLLPRIPFFFEPNFTAHVQPLAAALRLQEHETANETGQELKLNKYQPVVYGNFLLGKVGNNFVQGKGKYD